MSLLSPIKDHHSERRLFIARVIMASVVAVILLGIVIARLVQLQVIDYEHFAERSQTARVSCWRMSRQETLIRRPRIRCLRC